MAYLANLTTIHPNITKNNAVITLKALIIAHNLLYIHNKWIFINSNVKVEFRNKLSF